MPDGTAGTMKRRNDKSAISEADLAEVSDVVEAAEAADAAAPSGDAGVAEPPAEAAEVGGMPADRVASLETELVEAKDRHLRLAAEFDNFRKRVTRERDEIRVRSQAEVARRLLDALDDLGRVAHLDPAATAAADVIAGVELVERKVLRELGALGMVTINAADVPFDPQLHEAITTIPTDDEAQDHTVAAVFQVGYRFNGTLLRPARVQVRMYTPPA
jgi:molecular chaperone GrpE